MAKSQKKAVRVDPESRPLDGAIPFFDVAGKDPTRDYLWVYKAAGSDFNAEHYEGMGWDVEFYRTGGPRLRMMSVEKLEKLNGQVIESRGNVLMSISKERRQEIFENGDDGVSGQKMADVMERRLLDRSKHMKDAMRGINPRLRDAGFEVEFDKGSIVDASPSGDD